MEMNTRLQVEHPVTEMVTGMGSGRVAGPDRGGGEADRRARPILRCRAMRLKRGSTPRIRRTASCPPAAMCWRCWNPMRPGVRVDSGLSAGMVVGSDYDPMLAKVIAHGADRAAALRTLDRALADTAVLGVVTNIEFVRFLLADPDVVAGRLDTGLLDRRAGDFVAAPPADEQFVAAAAFRWLRRFPARGADLWEVPSGWRVGRRAPVSIRLRAGERTDHVHIAGVPRRCRSSHRGRRISFAASGFGRRPAGRHTGRAARRVHRRRSRQQDLVGRRRGTRGARGGARSAGARQTTSTAATPN